MTDTPSRVLAEAADYVSLLDAFRARAAELGITRLEIDEIGGLTSGRASKLLAPIPIKGFGRTSLGPLLGALALKLVVVEDPAMLPRVVWQLGHKRATAGRSFGPQRRPDGDGAPQLDFGGGAPILAV